MAAEPKKNRAGGPSLTGGDTGSHVAVDEKRIQEQAQTAATASSARQAIVSKPLSVSPLSALLPRLGDAKGLDRVMDILNERLEDLRQEAPPTSEDALRGRMLEEEMLIQVIGWATGEGSKKRKA